MPAALRHKTLQATLHGHESGKIWQFRGLQYGSIPARFSSPGPPAEISGDVDCTEFGPRCPQNYIDFRHLLRIPPSLEIPEQREDEFACLNLDITLPANPEVIAPGPLPVLIWIHGGSQAVSFGTASTKLCDPTKLVEESISIGKPIIVVTINYRLNIFAFGDTESEPNLALRDQRKAFGYIASHIGGFGGDPAKITVAGESAGAVYCHAHMAMGLPARQYILQSGSLHLSPPQPRSAAVTLIRKVETTVSDLGGWNLRTAPVDRLLEALKLCNLVSFYLQQETQLEGWGESVGSAERLLIGDNEYESNLWRNGIEELPADTIWSIFELAGDKSEQLRDLYGITADRPTQNRTGALDFLNDARFVLPAERIVEEWRRAERPVFRFLVDQPNPWQTSSRAHHGVDLLYLFGGFDLSFDAAAQNISYSMQHKWIQFINGDKPWSLEQYWAFGPVGLSKAIDGQEFKARRRARHLALLREIGHDGFNPVFGNLAAGRISLLN
ncbi:unnamed protein product [Clonostachys rosea f. rosea IK726]|uniref:Carboxylic ester hydrolase n=2 Tax=Bionectria ochroleuca TaxID=29856 RepID=A0A0B7JW92_BIOOC|nr:unnamed protein product [Clonostachys rosea f. rosea IK726]